MERNAQNSSVRRVIVTGTSRGIGKATAEAISAAPGHEVIGTSSGLKEPVAGPDFDRQPLDLSKTSSIQSFVEQLADIPVFALINNAAVLLDARGDSTLSMSAVRESFEVNLFGLIELTELLIARLEPGACIINISSDWGSSQSKDHDAFNPAYKMSKAALNEYTRLLAARIQSERIRICAYDPGHVRTSMSDGVFARSPQQAAADIFALIHNKEIHGKFMSESGERPW